MCLLVLPGVHIDTGLGFQEDIVYIACSQMREKAVLVGESGTVIPLLTSALHLGVPPSQAPVHFTFSHSHDSEVWRVLTTADIGKVPHGQGIQITKCYISVVRSTFS